MSILFRFGLPLFCLGLYSLYFASVLYPFPDFHFQLVEEDQIGEYLQFFLYFLSGLLFFVGGYFSKDSVSRWVRFGLCFLLFFIAGEEISWGSRLLNFSAPFIQKHNYRGDVDFHNLFYLYGKWVYYPIFALLFGIVIPFAEKILQRSRQSYEPVFQHSGYLMTMIFVGLLCTVFASTYKFLYLFEFSELIFSVCFLYVALGNLRTIEWFDNAVQSYAASRA